MGLPTGHANDFFHPAAKPGQQFDVVDYLDTPDPTIPRHRAVAEVAVSSAQKVGLAGDGRVDNRIILRIVDDDRLLGDGGDCDDGRRRFNVHDIPLDARVVQAMHFPHPLVPQYAPQFRNDER